jgi:VanZ family protein
MTRPLPVLWWLTTIAWAVLIFSLSSRTFGSNFTQVLLAEALRILHIHVSWRTFELVHMLFRKLAHMTEYGILALFVYGPPDQKGLVFWRPRRALIAVLIAAAYSLTDEFHQFFVPGRTASLLDCGLDTVGASLAMLVPYFQEYFYFPSSDKKFSTGS